MSESKDKELSLDELKDASGGIVHPQFRKGIVHPQYRDGEATGFTELGKISLNLNDDIKRKESGEKFIWPDSEDRPPQDQ